MKIKYGFFCNLTTISNYKKQKMKKHEVHILKKTAGFSSMKEELSKEVEQFLDKKVNAGYEVVSISFTYYESRELVAFITICR